MKSLPLQGRTWALLGVIVPLLVLFIYVGLRSGPLAPVAVTVVDVESRAVAPALFGIGTVEARYTFKIGPTFTGRLKRLDVHVGDRVKGGSQRGQRLHGGADDVVVRLLRGQRTAGGLCVKAHPQRTGIFCAEAVTHHFGPDAARSAEFTDFFKEIDVRVEEE